MNILVVNWQDLSNPQAGGAEVHLFQLFSRIAARGHGVTLLCHRYRGSRRREHVAGMTVVRWGPRAIFNLVVPFVYLFALRRSRFDVVIEDLNKVPFFLPLFSRTPVLGLAHHLFGRSVFRETNLFAAAYVAGMEWFALRLYRRLDIPFVVVSPSTRAEFLAHGFAESRIHVVYNCVDHERFRPTGILPGVAPRVGYCGRLKRYKCIDDLLRAAAELQHTFPALEVVIVGEGDDRPRLQKLAAELGVEGRTEFTGFVGEAHKVDLLQSMWCAVSTSSKEGWGLTTIEANACGTPVVAADVSGLRDVVKDGETGLLYPHGDVPQLIRQLTRILQEGELRARLRAGALAWARSFDWNVSATRMLEIIEARAGGTNLPPHPNGPAA